MGVLEGWSVPEELFASAARLRLSFEDPCEIPAEASATT
jgi:hypothetical protein